MRNFCLVLILVTVIWAPACQRREPSLIVKYKNIGSIKEGANVTLNGLLIGKVQDFHIAQDAILTGLSMQKGVKIPVGSRFIVHQSLLGTASIAIEPSNKPAYLTQADTVLGESYREAVLDSVKQRKAQVAISKMAEGFAELVQALNKDSASSR